MGGCIIVSSGKAIIRDFDDYQEEILVSITASELKKAGIDSSDFTVTFYGYDFAWYDGREFVGVVKSS